jgi:hypothetical protein
MTTPGPLVPGPLSTFGGGYRPGLQTVDTDLPARPQYLASEKYRVLQSGITIAADLVTADADGNKIIHAGDVMVLLVAGDHAGKYLPYDSAATGAAAGAATAGNAKGLLFAGDMNVRWADTANAGLLIDGAVVEARISNIDAATKAALPHIQFQ